MRALKIPRSEVSFVKIRLHFCNVIKLENYKYFVSARKYSSAETLQIKESLFCFQIHMNGVHRTIPVLKQP